MNILWTYFTSLTGCLYLKIYPFSFFLFFIFKVFTIDITDTNIYIYFIHHSYISCCLDDDTNDDVDGDYFTGTNVL